MDPDPMVIWTTIAVTFSFFAMLFAAMGLPMNAKIRKEIRDRKQLEKDASDLARKYGANGSYHQAAIWYRSAEFHKKVGMVLADLLPRKGRL